MIVDDLLINNVFNEMQEAEQVLLSWNAHWSEKIEKSNCFDDQEEVIGVLWHDIITNNAIRNIFFGKNGLITIEKPKTSPFKKGIAQISYKANFNVMADDFAIDITISRIDKNSNHKYITTEYSILGQQDTITIKSDGIAIVEDRITGIKTVNIYKPSMRKTNAKPSPTITFDATLDKDGVLTSGNINVETHKGNGKVNGRYHLALNKETGISSTFISRKGNKVDLLDQTLSLSHILMLPESSDANKLLIEVANKGQSIAEFENGNNKNTYDFSMDRVISITKNAKMILGEIKGELVLTGLQKRISSYLRSEKEKYEEDIKIKLLKR